MSHPPLSVLLEPIRSSRDFVSFDRQAERPILQNLPHSARHPPPRRALSPLKCLPRNGASFVPMCVLPRTARRAGRENARPLALPLPVVRHLAMEKANALREARLEAVAAERQSQALLAAERESRPELQFKVEVIDEPSRREIPIPIPLPAPRVVLPPTTLSITGHVRRRRAVSELDPIQSTTSARTDAVSSSTRARSAESPTRQLLEV